MNKQSAADRVNGKFERKDKMTETKLQLRNESKDTVKVIITTCLQGQEAPPSKRLQGICKEKHILEVS